MNKTELEALLGRSLTTRENTNYKLYLKIAEESLENLLCLSLDCKQVSENRTFDAREGYSTVFVGIFTEVSEVKVDDDVVSPDSYYPAQWDNRNASWYNSIVFTERFDEASEIEVTADWGFDEQPSHLKQLIAQLFANVSKKYSVGNVKSKRVEDFSITYSDLTDDQAFQEANKRVIQQYSLCNVGNIRHGEVC